ncbi:MAG: tetratricopeptide repeat protein [Bacteroidaceae bacterium]|nr:tetratricopeptide repeat protein [Bacteroidaceae bacterium]
MRNILFVIFFSLPLSAFAQQEEGKNVLIPSSSQRTKEDNNPFANMTISQQMEKAAAYIHHSRYQQAKDIYDNVIRLEPDNFTALYFRAFANQQLFHFGLARADYNNILKTHPDNYHALMGRAQLNQSDNRHTEALDDANLLVEIYPDSINAWLIRAEIEEKQKLIPLAEFDYQQAYTLNTANKKYLLKAVELKLKQNKKEEAKRILDNLVKQGTPKNALLYYYKKINLRNP